MGVVTLRESVRLTGQKEDYSRVIAKIPGVSKVVNNLKALPNSPFDDQVRFAVARVIYQDSSFHDLAIQPNRRSTLLLNTAKSISRESSQIIWNAKSQK